MSEPIGLILDVDTGVDDAMALALAARSPAVNLLAVTTVAGNVTLPHTTENTLRVLAHLGRADVPVHKGFSRPLARPLHQAQHVHGQTGLGTLRLPPAPRAARKPSAPEFLVETIMAAPGTIMLACVGPLTNLAAAIAIEPTLPNALKRLVIMGGSLGSGNVTPAAEFNIYVDPDAAAQVFAACELTMVGLDVTEQTTLSRAAWDRLARAETAAGELVYGVCAQSFLDRGLSDVQLHDPLAVGVAIDPSLCSTKRGIVNVETASASRAGQTTLDERADGPHAVCMTVDTSRFLDLFSQVLSAEANAESRPRRAERLRAIRYLPR